MLILKTEAKEVEIKEKAERAKVIVEIRAEGEAMLVRLIIKAKAGT